MVMIMVSIYIAPTKQNSHQHLVSMLPLEASEIKLGYPALGCLLHTRA